MGPVARRGIALGGVLAVGIGLYLDDRTPRRDATTASASACPRGRRGCACTRYGGCDDARCRDGVCDGAPCPVGAPRCACRADATCARGGTCRQGICLVDGDPVTRGYLYSARVQGEVERVHALILARAGFAPGMRVADVGAGRGLLTFAIAARIGPTGVVWATDIADAALAALRAGAARVGPGGARVEVRPVRSPVETALDDVPAGSLHRVLMINVFGFSATVPWTAAQAAQLRGFARLLRPDGELLYHQDWLDGELDEAGVAARFAEAGLVLRGEINLDAAGMPPRAEVFDRGFDAPPRTIRRGYLLRFGPRGS
ncbi:MAG: methyltransferase domain-containing protein [Polyangiales bacterium]